MSISTIRSIVSLVSDQIINCTLMGIGVDRKVWIGRCGAGRPNAKLSLWNLIDTFCHECNRLADLLRTTDISCADLQH